MREWLLLRITGLKSASAGWGKVCVLSSGRISFSLTGSRASTHALGVYSLSGICNGVCVCTCAYDIVQNQEWITEPRDVREHQTACRKSLL